MDSVAEVLTTAIQGAAANTRASFQQIIDEKDKEIKSSAAKIERYFGWNLEVEILYSEVTLGGRLV